MDTVEIKDITSPGELKVVNEKKPGVLCTLEGPFGSSVEPTRNTRLYIRELWDKILNSDDVKEMLETKTFFGEADHPLAYQERLEAHIPQISHNITELKMGADGVIYGKLDVLDTPNGRIVKTLIDYGSKLGISSRGAGEVIRTNEHKSPIVNPENYTFITFDLVVMPGAKVARLHESSPMRESLATDFKAQLTEAISCKDISSLENMRGLLEYVTDSGFNTLKEQVNTILAESTDTISDDATEELLTAYGTISELENKLSESVRQVEQLTKKLKVARSQYDTARNTISELSEELSESTKQVQELQSETQSLNESVKSLQSENSQLLESVQELRTQSTEHCESITTYETMINDYQEELRDINKDYRALQEKHTKSVNEFSSSYESLKRDLNNALSDNHKLVESYKDKLISTLTEYAVLRCESVGMEPARVLNESYLRSDSTVEDIDNLIREMLSQNTRSRLVESVSPMIIQDTKSIKSANSIRSSRTDDGESDRYLSDITETVARMNNNINK